MPTTIPGNLIFQSPTNNDPLLDLNTQPSLDLQFAASKTLDDRVSGLPLVDHQRDVSSGKSAGTYVGSDGLIKTSKVNLLTYSEEFDQWNQVNVVLTADDEVSPDRTLTAERVTNVVGQLSRVQRIVDLSNDTLYTLSVYAKSFSANKTIAFEIGGFGGIVVDLGTGVFTGSSIESGYVEGAENGWKRVVATFLTPSSGISRFQAIYIGNYGSSSSLCDVAIWGAQLEEGTTASPYIPTTNLPSAAPRFDHDPETGESLGLLIEESRTNLLTYSEDFTDATWLKEGNGGVASAPVVTPNAAASPDGQMTADRIQFNLNGGTTISDVSQVRKTLVTTAGTHTVSFYFRSFDGTSSYEMTYRDADGLVHAMTVTGEWTRVTRTTSNYPSGATTVGFALRGGSFADSDTADILVWGAQLEAGSYPTSYIPTSGSTVTRAADVAEITGSNFSSWYNQTEGTVFTEADGEGSRIVGLNDGTDSNRQELFQSGNNVFCFQKNANVNEVNISIAAEDKSVFAYKANDYSVTSSGGSVVTDTSATPPTVNQMSIGNWYNDTGQLNGTISRLTYYPYRLPDATLQEITS